MTRRTRLAAGLVALATTGLLAATTLTAQAGVIPSPGPSPTQFGGGGQCSPWQSWCHRVKLQPEQFDITITNLNPSGDVEAFGPVAMHLGTDSSTTFRDVLADGLGDSVNVDRARLPLPTLDLLVCSATFAQADAPWRFDGGTGIWDRATGSGVFNLEGLVSYREVIKRGWDWGRPKVFCPLQGVSPWFVRWSIEHGGAGLPRPVIYEFGVQATGFASVRPAPKPHPCPTQTINHFAPTTGPSPLDTCDPTV